MKPSLAQKWTAFLSLVPLLSWYSPKTPFFFYPSRMFEEKIEQEGARWGGYLLQNLHFPFWRVWPAFWPISHLGPGTHGMVNLGTVVAVGRSGSPPQCLHFPVCVLFASFLPVRNVFKVRDNTIKVILSENQSCVCDGMDWVRESAEAPGTAVLIVWQFDFWNESLGTPWSWHYHGCLRENLMCKARSTD